MGGGRISWTFSLLVAATMIAALGAEEAGSKDNEDSVALVQKGSFVGYLLWPEIEATFGVCGNKQLVIEKNELSPNLY